ncbi:MAG: NAD(P)/FAD-dependent oxidoreductase [Patescibacteria group bacterium]
MEKTNQIVIVGAGPVGLALSLVLAKYHIPSTLYESRIQPTPENESRAIVIMPKGLEFLTWLGIEEPFIQSGVKRIKHEFRSRENNLLLTLPFNKLITDYPYTLQLPQHDTEKLLEEAAKQTGLVTINRGFTLKTLQNNNDDALATFIHDKKEIRVKAPWIVGCDGAHSTVRESLGIKRLWKDYGTFSAVADFEMTCNLPMNTSSIILDPQRPYGFFLFAPNRWRFIYRLNDNDNREEMIKEEKATALLHEKLPSVKIKKFLWASSFRLGQGQCETYFQNHCILAGDAAHPMGPSAGAGMMVGLMGAWRLGIALHKITQAPHNTNSFLTTYFQEQTSGSKAVQQSNHIIFANMALKNTLAASVREQGLKLVAHFPSIVNRLTRTEALLDQHMLE